MMNNSERAHEIWLDVHQVDCEEECESIVEELDNAELRGIDRAIAAIKGDKFCRRWVLQRAVNILEKLK